MESCESGSMFEGLLPQDWEIYATTAADPSESSWATYCEPDDVINGKSVGTCLGDEYSVNWMEDTEGAERDKKLQKQFEDVKSKTKGSHVQQYGVLSWTDEPITNYQGDVAEFTIVDKFFNLVDKCIKDVYYYFHKDQKKIMEQYKLYLEKAKESRIDSRDAKLTYLKNRHMRNGTEETKNALNFELEYRMKVQDFFSHFDEKFGITNTNILSVKDFSCLKRSVQTFKTSCESLWDEYTLKFVKHLYAACQKTTSSEIESYIQSNC